MQIKKCVLVLWNNKYTVFFSWFKSQIFTIYAFLK